MQGAISKLFSGGPKKRKVIKGARPHASPGLSFSKLKGLV